MYVKEDLILPHNLTFYELIVNKARGKSGPLFHFDVHDDVRMVGDARVEKDESHAGKVMDKRVYERNKDKFPYSRFEVYDPKKSYDTYSARQRDVRRRRRRRAARRGDAAPQEVVELRLRFIRTHTYIKGARGRRATARRLRRGCTDPRSTVVLQRAQALTPSASRSKLRGGTAIACGIAVGARGCLGGRLRFEPHTLRA